jgi:hypothetical protein
MATCLHNFIVFGLMAGTALQAQTDPGPRPGPPTAGRPLPGLNANQLAYFNEGAGRFGSVDSVKGTQPGAPDSGLASTSTAARAAMSSRRSAAAARR